MGEPAFLYGHQVKSGCASYRHPSACLMQRETLPHKAIFYPFGNPLFTTSAPPRLRRAHQIPLICVCIRLFSIYRCVTIELAILWTSVVFILDLPYLFHGTTTIVISRRPTFEMVVWLHREWNRMSLHWQVLPMSPCPQPFQSRLRSFSKRQCCFFRKYTFD